MGCNLIAAQIFSSNYANEFVVGASPLLAQRGLRLIRATGHGVSLARDKESEQGRREEGGRKEGGRREEGGREEGGRRKEGGRREEGGREEGGRREA